MERQSDSRADASQLINLHSPTVEIMVGIQSAQHFHIHRNILSQASDFFKTWMSTFSGKTERHFCLPDADPKIFAVYANFLYVGKLGSGQPEGVGSEVNEKSAHQEYTLLCDLYLFALEMRDRTAMRAAFNGLLARYKGNGGPITLLSPPSHELVKSVYFRTDPTSPLRRLLVDMHVWYGQEHAMGTASDSMPGEFVWDLARALLRQQKQADKSGGSMPTGIDGCEYHNYRDCEVYGGRKRKRTD